MKLTLEETGENFFSEKQSKEVDKIYTLIFELLECNNLTIGDTLSAFMFVLGNIFEETHMSQEEAESYFDLIIYNVYTRPQVKNSLKILEGKNGVAKRSKT